MSEKYFVPFILRILINLRTFVIRLRKQNKVRVSSKNMFSLVLCKLQIRTEEIVLCNIKVIQ